MKKLIWVGALLVTAGMLGSAAAATITNDDDTGHTLLVTEGGNQTSVAIAAGETIEICPQGCFVTMPNGDREALTGTETLRIEASRSVFD